MNIDLLLAEHLPAAIREAREEIAATADDLTALRAKLHRLEDIASAAGVAIDAESVAAARSEAA